MFFYLSKILFFLTTPIVWVFGLLLWGVLTKKPIRKKRLLWASLITFYFFANPFITDEFVRMYEEPCQSYTEIENTYDVVIVLGGFSNFEAKHEVVQFHSQTDRLMAAIKLYRTGKARKIMISSGSGQIMRPGEKEALYIGKYLKEIGIPEKDLIIEAESRNTRENAVNSAAILNDKYTDGNYILVTSASHMPRAKRCFNKVGLSVTPFSVDHQSGERMYVIDHLFIPSAHAMIRWQMLIKEWIGFVTYKMMGYM